MTVYSNGWVERSAVEDACQSKYPWFESEHIDYIVENDSKGRYELKGGWIRALSGHSIDVHIEKSAGDEIPDVLYHGTAPDNIDSILEEGLKPMSRDKVHLSGDVETAQSVGERHTQSGEPVILRVDVDCVEARGFSVGNPQEGLYTTERVPPECISVLS